MKEMDKMEALKQESIPRGTELLSLTPKEAQKFMRSFDLVISDCEGVLWHYFESIPDVGPGIVALKQAGKQTKFLSNNSVRSDAEYLAKLKSIGISDVKPNDIITPGKVMLNYLKQYYAGHRLFSLASPELNEIFRRSGIKVDFMEPQTQVAMHELIQKIQPDSAKISAVLYDLNFNLTFAQLAKAQQYLCMDNCAFIVGAIDTFVPVSKTFSAICTTGIISILRESCGKEPICLGKSGTTFCDEIISTYNIRDPSRVLYIGDNLFSDIPFGRACGFLTLFVNTGRSKINQLNMMPSHLKPDYVLESVADFVEFFDKFGRPTQ